MGILSKYFGPSKLEEDFKKAISLKWVLIIEPIGAVYVQKDQITIKKSNALLNFQFNFKDRYLLIQGDFFEEDTRENQFKISHIINQNDKLEIYYSSFDDTSLILVKCIINREYILLERTLSNWHCKLFYHNIMLTNHLI